MTSDIEVRPIREGELPDYLEVMSAAFLDRPDIDKLAEELAPLWDLSRVLAAFDGDRVVGTFRSFGTELTLPGCARLPGAAIASVTVLPTHRRLGILRRMTATKHLAIRERSEAISLLHAAEYPIYGRFGYGPASRVATWTLDALGARFHAEPTGSVEIVKPSAETRDLVKGVFETWRSRRSGEVWRRDLTWDYDLGLRESAWGGRWKGFLALHRNAAGSVDGYVRYTTEGKWDQRQPRANLAVNDLHALDDDAYLALWRFVAEIDWVKNVTAERRRLGERLPWLLENARAAAVSDVGDELWVRLMDVPRALEARTYEREGRLVLEIADPEAPGGRLRVELDAGPAGAACRPTTREPDLSLDVSALGAAYLGGTPLSDAVAATGVDEGRAGALAEADALFRTLDEPWCSTFF